MLLLLCAILNLLNVFPSAFLGKFVLKLPCYGNKMGLIQYTNMCILRGQTFIITKKKSDVMVLLCRKEVSLLKWRYVFQKLNSCKSSSMQRSLSTSPREWGKKSFDLPGSQNRLVAEQKQGQTLGRAFIVNSQLN